MADDDFGDAELWAAIDNAAAARYGRPAPINPVVSDRSLVVSRCQQSPARRAPLVELPPSPQTVAARIDAKKENAVIGQKRQQVHFRDERAAVRQKQNHQRFPAGRSPLQQISCTEMISHDTSCIDNAQPQNMMNQWMNGVGFPSTAVFRHFQDAAMGILDKGDYVMMQGKPFIKKCGWRKIAFFFNISFEIKDRKIDLDQSANVLRAEFVVRATMQSGRFSDGWGSCDVREKRFSKPNHDIPSTAETRAKTRACQDLLGIGEIKTSADKW